MDPGSLPHWCLSHATALLPCQHSSVRYISVSDFGLCSLCFCMNQCKDSVPNFCTLCLCAFTFGHGCVRVFPVLCHNTVNMPPLLVCVLLVLSTGSAYCSAEWPAQCLSEKSKPPEDQGWLNLWETAYITHKDIIRTISAVNSERKAVRELRMPLASPLGRPRPPYIHLDSNKSVCRCRF